MPGHQTNPNQPKPTPSMSNQSRRNTARTDPKPQATLSTAEHARNGNGAVSVIPSHSGRVLVDSQSGRSSSTITLPVLLRPTLPLPWLLGLSPLPETRRLLTDMEIR